MTTPSKYFPPQTSAREPNERRLRNLLKRIADGDTPRASYAEYKALCLYDGVGPLLQLESALGADRSGGNIITALHSGFGSARQVCEAAQRWLLDNPIKPDVTTEALQRAGIISSDPNAKRAKSAGSSPALRVACPVCHAAPGAYCTKTARTKRGPGLHSGFPDIQIIAHKRRREEEERTR